ncbi:MAG: KH domain-containing protein [Armatimonadetes bacterium]|nr:KH domain-containing protein [Armatimonadota bacterium]
MKELVEILARALVDQPDKVAVNMFKRENSYVIELRVAPEDMGKVIGRQGKIAKAIRTVVKAAATRKNKKVVVEII